MEIERKHAMDLSNFEPIESAPRDGTSVIVACEGHPEFVKESLGLCTPHDRT